MKPIVEEKIRELLTFAESHGLTEVTWQDKGFRVSFKRGSLVKAQSPKAGSKNGAAKEEEKKDFTVRSPLVGTFRRSVSKDRPPLIVEGEHVKPGDRLGVVECMKIPTDVTSFCEGIISKILVDDGQKVEYGQPLFEMGPMEESTGEGEE